MLTIRLTRVASKVISESQTAFIPGRNILDGAVMVHEVLHHLKVWNRRGVVLKLDFEKAYDKVSWSFLREALSKKGFPDKWIAWVMLALSGGRVAINLNGELGEFFRRYKGVRQGDPLSPLLFNLVADALSGILIKAKNKWVISGVVPDLVEGGLTHLQ